ncbi:MAG: T9SS type A sorting domain-containing protein [Salibacteraceae bacterium]
MKITTGILFFISLKLLAFSQSGPGGVGNSTNNEIWLVVEGNCFTDAGTTLGGNNASIQQWNDLSGNGNHAIETTPAFMPTLETNQANGFSSLMFDGGNDRILSSGVATSNQTTIFVAVKFNALTNNNDGIIQASPAGTAFTSSVNDKSIGMWINTSNGNIWGRGIQSNNTQRNISQTTSLSTGQFYIIAQDFNGSTIQQYVNGATAGNTIYNGTIKSWTEFGIARQGTESLDGELLEIIVYTNSVNAAQRIIIDNYLAAKYNLTLTSNDLYVQDNGVNGDFDFDVAGIGRIDASNTHTDAQGSGILRISNPSGLNNNEFLFWGHNNGVQQATETADVPAGVQGRFDREWRFNEVNTLGVAIDVGSVDMAWDLSGLGSVTASDLRLLIDSDNDGSFADETPISGANSGGGDVYEFTGVTGITNNTRLTLGTADLSQTPLPIELISFEVSPINSTVQLDWATASETNNDFFSIERSKDAQEWNVLKEISGAGNSSKKLDYQAIDENPLTGLSYYRLKQTDYNGKFQYFATRVVEVNQKIESDFQFYPNPADDMLLIYSSKKTYRVQILDVLGHAVLTANNPTVMEMSSVPTGTYFLRAEFTNGTVINRKLVVSR